MASDQPLWDVTGQAPDELGPVLGRNSSASSVDGSLSASVTQPSLTRSNGKTSAAGRHRNHHLKCPYDDCTHEGTFHRRYELQRHVLVKHKDEKPFQCPYAGCFSRNEKTAFARADKLTSHVRSVHARHADKLLECCAHGCNKTALPLDLLGVHIWQAQATPTVLSHFDEKARGLKAAASTAYRQCPLWRCAKMMPLSLSIGRWRFVG